MMFSHHRIFKRLAKALIKLRVCAGWSEYLLIAHTTLLEMSCYDSCIRHSSHTHRIGSPGITCNVLLCTDHSVYHWKTGFSFFLFSVSLSASVFIWFWKKFNICLMSSSCFASLREVASEISPNITNMETNKGFILSSLFIWSAFIPLSFPIIDEHKFSVFFQLFSESISELTLPVKLSSL